MVHNFLTNEARFECVRRMLAQDVNRYTSVSISNDGIVPDSVSLPNTNQLIPTEREQTYIRDLTDLGIVSVYATKGGANLDFYVATWGLSVAGGSLSYS